METKSSLFTHKNNFILLMLLFSLFGMGCQHIKTRDEVKDKKEVSEGPFDEEVEAPKEQPEEEPREKVITSKKVGLILGPGGAKALAHTGVIKALVKQKVEIQSVVGLGWGALVGGIYANTGKIHKAEWVLYKLNQKKLFEGGLINKEYQPVSSAKLNEFLNLAFKKDKINSSEISFSCPSSSLWTGAVKWYENGAFSSALHDCIQYPPLSEIKGFWVAAPFEIEDSVKKLQAKGVDLIIFVNVLGRGELLTKDIALKHKNSLILWNQLRLSLKKDSKIATETINVPTSSIAINDFSKRSSAMLIGEKAGARAFKKLTEKYGL